MWTYDPNLKTTGDGHDLICRTDIEEAADRLWKAGIRNQRLLAEILSTLSGLSQNEVAFTLQLYFPRKI